MNRSSQLIAAYRLERVARNICTTLLAGRFMAAQITPALATIDNTANAVGTYNSSTNNYGSSSQNVPVTPGAPALTVTKAASIPTVAAGSDATISDAGDTITYTYTVKNTGNVTLTSVMPTDTGPTFNGSAGTGSMGAFSPVSATLAPNATQVFTATYTMSQLDVDHAAGISNGVSNTAGATGKKPDNSVFNSASTATATATIAAGPKLTIAKTFVITTDTNANGKADLGDVVTYTYVVTNTGNVTMTNVQVNDLHVGVAVPLGAGGITSETLTSFGPLGAAASTDTTANNGIWSSLAPGASVTFTWAHTVTQAEVDHG